MHKLQEHVKMKIRLPKYAPNICMAEHNGGNDRFCARLKVPPFSLKYEWQFWSKFYRLQIYCSSVAISLKKNCASLGHNEHIVLLVHKKKG
jgi:hypothetical protein